MGVRRFYEDGYQLQKAGVILLDLASSTLHQGELDLEDLEPGGELIWGSEGVLGARRPIGESLGSITGDGKPTARRDTGEQIPLYMVAPWGAAPLRPAKGGLSVKRSQERFLHCRASPGPESGILLGRPLNQNPTRTTARTAKGQMASA